MRSDQNQNLSIKIFKERNRLFKKHDLSSHSRRLVRRRLNTAPFVSIVLARRFLYHGLVVFQKEIWPYLPKILFPVLFPFHRDQYNQHSAVHIVESLTEIAFHNSPVYVVVIHK